MRRSSLGCTDHRGVLGVADSIPTELDHYLEGDFYVTGEGQTYFCLDPTTPVFLRIKADGAVYCFTRDSAEETICPLVGGALSPKSSGAA